MEIGIVLFFRVNRVLNRLAVFDTHMTGGSVQKMPPIVQVDLFTAEDDSGKIFKTYPQHQVFHKRIICKCYNLNFFIVIALILKKICMCYFSVYRDSTIRRCPV